MFNFFLLKNQHLTNMLSDAIRRILGGISKAIPMQHLSFLLLKEHNPWALKCAPRISLSQSCE